MRPSIICGVLAVLLGVVGAMFRNSWGNDALILSIVFGLSSGIISLGEIKDA